MKYGIQLQRNALFAHVNRINKLRPICKIEHLNCCGIRVRLCVALKATRNKTWNTRKTQPKYMGSKANVICSCATSMW